MSAGHPQASGTEPSFDDGSEARPRRLGRYELCFRIATGGMASVYLGRATGPSGFEKLVAIKTVHPHLAEQPGFADMFLDEARIVSRIGHPNVCAVFDFGTDRGTSFIAMEYLFGEPLSAVLPAIHARREEPIGAAFPYLAARIVAEAAEGLHAAHELRRPDGEPLGVVHRDVSPHNIFVTFEGAVKVVDFGIARARDRIHTTREGGVKGKYAYMAPEQAKGATLERTADVWSLGVVLWECLSLRRLFRKETEAETIYAVLGAPIPPPSSLREGVPPALEAIAMRALDRDPERRFATGREMAQAISRALLEAQQLVDMAALADLMNALFDAERIRQTRLVALAETGARSVPEELKVTEATPSLGALVEAPTTGSARASEGLDPMTTVPLPVAAPDKPGSRDEESSLSVAGSSPTPAPLAASSPAPARGRRWLPVSLVLIGVTVLGLGALTAFVFYDTFLAAAPPPPEEVFARGALGAPAEQRPEAEAAVSAHELPEEAPAAAEADDQVEEAVTEEVEFGSADEAAGEATERGGADPTHPRRRGVEEVGPSGQVQIVTVGFWADIYLRRRHLGRTPGTFELPPGRHRLELRGPDDLVLHRWVTITSGRTTPLSVTR